MHATGTELVTDFLWSFDHKCPLKHLFFMGNANKLKCCNTSSGLSCKTIIVLSPLLPNPCFPFQISLPIWEFHSLLKPIRCHLIFKRSSNFYYHFLCIYFYLYHMCKYKYPCQYIQIFKYVNIVTVFVDFIVLIHMLIFMSHYFVVVVFLNFLCIPYVHPLLNAWFTNIFYNSNCLFTSWCHF